MKLTKMDKSGNNYGDVKKEGDMTNKKIIYKPVAPEVLEIAEAHHNEPESMLEILKDIQLLPWGLTPSAITDAGRALNVPAHQAYGMATFYSMLSLEERKNILRVCDGPVCWLKKAGKQSSVISDWLSALGEDLSVERSSCLGLCDRAPAVLIDDEQAGPVSPEDANKVCEGWRGIPMDYSQVRKGETRVMTALIGKIDPDSIDDAIAHGVYDGLKTALLPSGGPRGAGRSPVLPVRRGARLHPLRETLRMGQSGAARTRSRDRRPDE